jgi:hypothetical protein
VPGWGKIYALPEDLEGFRSPVTRYPGRLRALEKHLLFPSGDGGTQMVDEDATTLELLVTVKHLRFNMIRSAVGLGLTLVNLAKLEQAVGNPDRAVLALSHAKKVYQCVMEYLPQIQLNVQEEQWATENLSELERAIESGPNKRQ